MKKTIIAFLKREDAKEVQSEYTILLSAGFSDVDAEEAIISYFLSNCTESQREMFWISFALIQWRMGRLSEKVHATAREYLSAPHTVISHEAAEEIANLLVSPMLERKRVMKPHAIKCPWAKGSLLAYQIASNREMRDSRFWNRYVLLRIFDIKQWPLSSICPHLLYDESMYVVLYNWVGDTIPDPTVIENLKLTPIAFRKPIFSQLQISANLGEEYPEYVFALDWGNLKRAETIFTGIQDDCDAEKFSNSRDWGTKIPPMIGCAGFDTILIKRLEQLFPEKGD